MENSGNIKTEFEDFAKNTENYINTRLELLKLKAIAKIADVVSSIFSRLAVLIVFIFSLVILNIGLSFYVGELLHNTSYGFFAVSGFYVFLTIILYLLRNRFIKTKVSNSVINILLKED